MTEGPADWTRNFLELSKLSASWHEMNAEEIADSAGRAARQALGARAVCLRTGTTDVIHCTDGDEQVWSDAIEQASSKLPRADGGLWTGTITDPHSHRQIGVAATTLEDGPTRGALICFGIVNDDFGIAQEALLQALALQTASALQRHRERRERQKVVSRMERALEASEIGHWELNLSDNRAFRNLRHDQIFGYDELLPTWTYEAFIEHVLPEDREQVAARFDEAVRLGTHWDFECRIRRADDQVRWIWARGRALDTNEDGEELMAGTVADITRRKHLEAELRQRLKQLAETNREKQQLLDSLREADRQKDEFLATLAHELRNPLATISNALYLLELMDVDASTLEENRSMMQRQVQHLVQIVDDLLDISRIVEGKIRLRKQPTELQFIIDSAVEMVASLMESKDHDLRISIDPDLPKLNVDPTRISQVVGNLLTNAAKYTSQGGHITLSVERYGQEVVITVKDDGIGIAPDQLSEIFELFAQADRSTDKAHGGIGVGLTLAKSLVELHDGHIEAHSPGKDEGSKFVVRLPVEAIDAEQQSRRVDEPKDEPRADTDQRILVVDDNEDAATTLGLLLELNGYEVEVAHDGPTALETAADFAPDLIFLDLGMPGMDGYEVARKLSEDEPSHRATLVALTGWSQPEDRRRTEEAGFDYHFVKPLDPLRLEQLLVTLR